MDNKMNWTQDEINKFWSKVNYPGNDQECWEWTAYRDKDNYGKIEGYGAHRRAWEFYNGIIPNNLCVCHTCDNPPCCNPEHLFLGTSQENTQDKINKGRQIKGSEIGTAKMDETDVKQMLTNILESKYTSVQDILRDYIIAKSTFENIIYKNGWSLITQEFDMLKISSIISTFARNNRQKLVAKDIKEIKQRLKENFSPQELADTYNVDPHTIYDIKSGRSWKNITI